MDLNGAVAIVTGGGRGLGRAIAEAYAGKGAHVAVVARTEEELQETAEAIRACGGRAMALPGDVTVREQVERVAEEVQQTFGPPDILVNNAGSLSAVGPTWEVEPEQWLTDVKTNLYGSMLCCRAVMPSMVKRRRGYILNLVGGGTTGPHLYGSGYGCSKAGLMALTETLAREAARTGVKVFALAPGLVRTRMTEQLAGSPEGRRWRPGIKERLDEGRHNPPELSAELALDLVSGRADVLTGRYFSASEDFDEIVENADAIAETDARTLRIRE